MVILSLLPLPVRTKILLLPKSLIRSDNTSALQSPIPCMSSAISRGVPERKHDVAEISC